MISVRNDSKLTPADTADVIPTLTQHRLDVLNGLDAGSERNVVDRDESIPLLPLLAILNREKLTRLFHLQPRTAGLYTTSDLIVSLSPIIIPTHMLGLRA